MRLRIGKIINTHGLKGEVKVLSSTDFPEQRFAKGSNLLITNGNRVIQEVVVESSRFHKGNYLVKFENFDDINDVEKFKTLQLKVEDSEKIELEDGEFYFYEIVDCEVYDEKDKLIGKVVDILQTGANDVWVLKNNEVKEYLIPYIDDVVKEIDIKNKKISIEVMEGLID